jgi:hypothetical protein
VAGLDSVRRIYRITRASQTACACQLQLSYLSFALRKSDQKKNIILCSIAAKKIVHWFHSQPSSAESQDSSVGILVGYGLDDKRVGVRVPVVSSPYRPAQLCGPLRL